jgi:hypothetical protein
VVAAVVEEAVQSAAERASLASVHHGPSRGAHVDGDPVVVREQVDVLDRIAGGGSGLKLATWCRCRNSCLACRWIISTQAGLWTSGWSSSATPLSFGRALAMFAVSSLLHSQSVHIATRRLSLSLP